MHDVQRRLFRRASARRDVIITSALVIILRAFANAAAEDEVDHPRVRRYTRHCDGEKFFALSRRRHFHRRHSGVVRPTVEAAGHVNFFAPVEVGVVLVVEDLERLAHLGNFRFGVNDERLLLQAHFNSLRLGRRGLLRAAGDALLFLNQSSQRLRAFFFECELSQDLPRGLVGRDVHGESVVRVLVVVPSHFVLVRDDKVEHARRRTNRDVGDPPVVIFISRFARRANERQLLLNATHPTVKSYVHDELLRVVTANRVQCLVPEDALRATGDARVPRGGFANEAPVLFKRRPDARDAIAGERHFSVDYGVRIRARRVFHGDHL